MQNQSKSYSNQINTLKQEADEAKHNSKYLVALQKYNQLLLLLSLQNQHDKDLIADIQYEKGDILCEQEKFSQARQVLEKSIKIKQQLTENESLDVAKVTLRIGIVYLKEKKFQQALKNIHKAMKIREKERGKDSLQYAQCIYIIGNYHYYQKNSKEGLKYFKDALEIQKVGGEEHFDIGKTLSSMGSIYDDQNNSFQAIKHYEKAAKIFEKTKSQNSLEAAKNFYNMGVTYYNNERKISKALCFFRQAENIFKMSEIKLREYCMTLFNIGTTQFQLDNYVIASIAFEKSLFLSEMVMEKSQIRRRGLRLARCFRALNKQERVRQLKEIYNLETYQI